MRELVMVMGFAFVPVSLLLGALWLSARSRADRSEAVLRELALGRYPREAAPPPALESHMTQALDALALEVERIAEGQRFTTRLLSERRESSVERLQGRVITPH